MEPKFGRLSHENKVNILLKALMIERERNGDKQVKIDDLKKEYVSKVESM